MLEVPDDLAASFRYRAGQFLTFRVPQQHHAGAFNRCYSLSSAPETDGRHLKVTVKRVEGGKGSNWFNDALAEGGTLHVLPPAGRFVLKEGGAPLLLLGGGSGITPMMSLIKSALRSGSRRSGCSYANRDKPSIIFDQELLGLLADHPGRLEIIHHLDAEQGLTQPQEIVAAVKGLSKTAEAYLCGPGPFMTLVGGCRRRNRQGPDFRLLVIMGEDYGVALELEPLDLGEQVEPFRLWSEPSFLPLAALRRSASLIASSYGVERSM